MSVTFGQRLVRWREAAGLTQAELAGRVGVTPTYIAHLEREVAHIGIGETRRPMIEVVEAIAAALDVPLAEVRCAAGYDPPAASGSACEAARGTFGESDFAALHVMHERLSPEQRRAFQPILEMVSRELQSMLKEQGAQSRKDVPPERRRRLEPGRRLPSRRPDVSFGHAPALRAGSKVTDEQ